MTDIGGKLERLEERYILEELTGELYAKYKGKFEKEAEELHKEMKQNKIELSKLDDYIAYSLMCCSNPNEMWHSGDYTQRQELQNALFEGGIVYDRVKDECRGMQVNEFVSAVALLSNSLATLATGNKKSIHLASLHPERECRGIGENEFVSAVSSKRVKRCFLFPKKISKTKKRKKRKQVHQGGQLQNQKETE